MLSRDYTLIKVSREVVACLKEAGRKGESYDVVIRMLLHKAGYL